MERAHTRKDEHAAAHEDTRLLDAPQGDVRPLEAIRELFGAPAHETALPPEQDFALFV